MQVDLKKLKPIGVVIVLLIGVMTLVTLFTADFGVPPRYTPMHDTAYYQESAEHMDELLREVRGNIVPDIPGVIDAEIAPDGATVVLRVERGELDKVRAVMKRDFGEGLFTYVEAD